MSKDALQKANPGVAVSIKTQQAARRILNSTRDNVIRMRLDGVIDEGESDKLEMVCADMDYIGALEFMI